MAITYEDGFNRLRQLAEWYSKTEPNSRNEATTRLHLINELFLDVLGWLKENCKAEERFGGEYADYVFYCPQRMLVVEAKREGHYFELPVGVKGSARLKIESIRRDSPAVGKAIEQAIGYCTERGTPFGAVTNGYQVIAFLGSRLDGIPPIDGSCLVFDSFDSMLKDFKTLWNALSYPGIQGRWMSTNLIEQAPPSLPDKLSQTIFSYPGTRIRNNLQANLQILADLLIEDVAKQRENEEQFLRECYCESGALSQYALVTKTILKTRYSSLFAKSVGASIRPVQTKNGIDPEFLARSLGRRPIILIGDVGVGKTTFLRNFLTVVAPDVVKKSIVFYVDFGSKPVSNQDIANFVFEQCRKQLLRKHKIDIENDEFVRAVYARELQRFSSGIFKELKASNPARYSEEEINFLKAKIEARENFFKDSLSYITSKEKVQALLYMDNVDQRTDDFQQQAFLTAQTMSGSMPITVFITLRPETFYRSKERGTLAAYDLRAFTVAPPRIDQVLERRLKYAIKLAEAGTLSEGLSAITVDSKTLCSYLKIIQRSFNTNRYLIEFIENMCGGNIRLALDFIRAFIGSGHIDTTKILKAGPSYQIPVHEFFRAVVYGDRAHFDPASSPVLNVFDVSTPDPREHFLLILIINQVNNKGQSAPEGYVDARHIFGPLQDLGFDPLQIDRALRRAVNKKLLETNLRVTSQIGSIQPFAYRATSVGVYYVKRMIATFPYMDAVIVDTPVLDENFREQIRDVDHIIERLDRCMVFLRYLDSHAKGIKAPYEMFPWAEMREHVERDIQRIRGVKKVRKASAQPGRGKP